MLQIFFLLLLASASASCDTCTASCKKYGDIKLTDCSINNNYLNCYISPIDKSPPPPPEFNMVSGELEVLVSHVNETEQFNYLLHENTSVFNPIPLYFNNDIGLVTGDNIKVFYKNTGRRLLDNSFGIEVDYILPNGDPTLNKDFVVDGKPVNITSLTMLVSMCKTPAPSTKAALQKRFFDKYASPDEITMQRHHQICSFNKLLFLPENNLIVDNINIPCTGTYNNAQYDTNGACGEAELYGWMIEALKQVTAQGIDLKKYKRQILIMPDRPKCPWAGLGSVGCPSICNVWENGYDFNDLTVLFHELGHNIGLLHSNRNNSWNSDEYGDCTDPMGSGWITNPLTNMICLNAPQQLKAGWSKLIENINFYKMPAGQFIKKSLPSMAITDTNMIRINISTLPAFGGNKWYRVTPEENAIYISYRSKTSTTKYDTGLTTKNAKVYIHSYNSTLQMPPVPEPSDQAFKPMLIGILDNTSGSICSISITPSFNWYFPELKAGIKISFVTKSITSADITICKYNSLSEKTLSECTNGIDDDCNGLSDDQEPDCKKYFNNSPSPTPRPSPSPTPSPSPDPTVVIYQNNNYKGLNIPLTSGRYTFEALKKMNKNFKDNSISSIKFLKSGKAILYDDDNFNGKTITTTKNIANLSSFNFNDKMSSIIVI
jgi:hypothetical protein